MDQHHGNMLADGRQWLPMTRRRFLQQGGVASLGLLSATQLTAQERAGAAQLIAGKDERLKVLSGKPVVLETPLGLLAEQAVTPKQTLFVRNNLHLADSYTLQPLPGPGWKIACGGLIQPAPVLDAEEVSKLAQVEHEMVLQCAGNARLNYNQAAPVPGTPWGRGGMGNVRFAGVPLAAVLEKYKIKVDPEARFLTAKGKDQPQKAGQAEFEHSLPLDEALKKTFLAFKLNGEPLPAVHGGPVRLITPGYFATMNVKWLASLRFDKTETTNHYQLPQYRTPHQLIKPGQKFEFTFTNSNPTWRMRVTSFILIPETGAKLGDGTVTFRGVAFNDGEARLEAVLVSLDRGRTWEQAALTTPSSPSAWYPWTFKAALKPGTHSVWSRAIDTLGRSQPLDGNIHWNPNGYAWHGVDKIELTMK